MKKYANQVFYGLLAVILILAGGLSLFYNRVILVGERIATETVAVDASTVRNGGRVNLNTATKEELCELPGIGEATADRIIAYREEHGAFHTVEEIMEIKGIGEKKYEDISREITV